MDTEGPRGCCYWVRYREMGKSIRGRALLPQLCATDSVGLMVQCPITSFDARYREASLDRLDNWFLKALSSIQGHDTYGLLMWHLARGGRSKRRVMVKFGGGTDEASLELVRPS